MSLAENLAKIQQRIHAACERVGRDPASVLLLAVSKSHPPETIRDAVEHGQIFFGENKIQEAKAKIPLSPGKARWHFIGHLQSNKVRDAVALFEMIQGVDSLAIAIAEIVAPSSPGFWAGFYRARCQPVDLEELQVQFANHRE